ncbi:MAG TPA: carboxypeptidase regulatory-like domain-containing protein [Bryobacteraceae bacterium]
MFSCFRSIRTLSQMVAFALLLFLVLPARSQEVTAAINGVVTDPSGAVVAGAKITATDQDRGSTFNTTTNDSGFYIFPRLPVGRYELRAENAGFRTAVQPNIVLQMNQNPKIDIQMQVGDLSQTVEVSSAPPLLQTENMQVSTVIDARTNTQLPLATRNYVQLTLLSPGAVSPNPSGFKSSQTTFNGARPYINGNREQANNFILDGIDNNQVSDNLVAFAPSVDAIQEFNMITNNASAEFGNFMGGVVNTTIKSGTNSFHGSAFEFFRNDQLNANEWQNNRTGAPRSLLRWNMFGGAAGGRIIKDKLFFFADYQGSRYNQPAVSQSQSVLPTAARSGDLRAYNTTIYDPNLTTIVNGSLVRVPFANAQIPANRINPIASAIVNSQYYLKPVNSGLTSNTFNSQRTYTHGDQGDAKVDWNISSKDRLFARYSRSSIDNPTINSNPLQYNNFGNFPIQNGVIDYTRTISPTLVNDFRAGVNYNVGNTGTSASDLPNLPQQFGIPGVQSNILPAQVIPTYTTFGSAGVYQLFADTVIQLSDTAIWTVGSHTFHIGFQYHRERINTFYAGNNGISGTFNYANNQYSGLAVADYLLGLPQHVGVGIIAGTWGQRSNLYGAFVQDTWRVTSRLTLNYGLRYNLMTPWVEVKDRQVNFAPFSGEVEFAGQSTFYNNNRALYNQYNGILNYQPRLGIAYQYSPKGVIRAAYTLSSYMEGSGTNLRLPLNPPTVSERDVQYSQPNANNPSTLLPGSTLSDGFATVGSKTNPFQGANIRLWDPNVRPAASHQWNFIVQQQLGSATTAQVGYVGQKNNHLIVAQPYRQGILNPNGTVTKTPYLSGNPTLYNAISQISGTESNGNMSYNALQATLVQRLAHGVQANFSYTWSKCMTDSTGFYGAGQQTAAQSAYVQNVWNRRAEWGPCGWDVTHNFTGYVSYDLPFGRGRAIGHDINRFADAFVGGWQVNGIVSLHNGFPITIYNPTTDSSGTGQRSGRANCVAPARVLGKQNASVSGGGFQWLDPSSFAAAAPGTFGNCGVATVRGPGLATTDLSLSKRFAITEAQNLEFRTEFINAFNHPILYAFDRTFGNSTFGVVQSSTGARNIQFGLKYNF